MKVAIVVLALVALVSCDPVQISNNNVGDVITVGISATAEVSNTVNQDIVNVIVALINQNAEISRNAAPLAETEVADFIEVGVPEMVEDNEAITLIGDSPPAQSLDNFEMPSEIFFNGDSPPIEDLESADVISQEALNHFVRVLPSGFQF